MPHESAEQYLKFMENAAQAATRARYVPLEKKQKQKFIDFMNPEYFFYSWILLGCKNKEKTAL